MKKPLLAGWTFFILLLAPSAFGSDLDDAVDRLDQALTVSAFDHSLRARLSGTLDLEGYRLPLPSPALLYSDSRDLFSPRLSLFLDAQIGATWYVFAQARVDRGFDPSEAAPRARLDEVAVRFTPWSDSRLNLQVGKFATVVGNWVGRHGSWENPFISAPLPYENLTGIWDVAPPRSVFQLQAWAHVAPNSSAELEQSEKGLRLPVIWGPAYATGAAVFGKVGKIDYAAEVKNTALPVRPDLWGRTDELWDHPAASARLGYRPNAMWNLGVSASRGPYLHASATPLLAPGKRFSDYQQTVLAQDASFAWHHWQVWAEIFQSRFALPAIGDARSTAYYVEAKYRFTAQFSAALRWNEQHFAEMPDGRGGVTLWGRDATRFDLAPTYRFTPHLQLKWQSSWLHNATGAQRETVTHAAQLTLRF